MYGRNSFDLLKTKVFLCMTNVKGKEFKYEYDAKKNVTKATSAEKMVYNLTYDSYGNIKEQKQTDAEDANSYMKISKKE